MQFAINVSHVEESSKNANLRQEDDEVDKRRDDSRDRRLRLFLFSYFLFDKLVLAVLV